MTNLNVRLYTKPSYNQEFDYYETHTKKATTKNKPFYYLS